MVVELCFENWFVLLESHSTKLPPLFIFVNVWRAREMLSWVLPMLFMFLLSRRGILSCRVLAFLLLSCPEETFDKLLKCLVYGCLAFYGTPVTFIYFLALEATDSLCLNVDVSWPDYNYNTCALPETTYWVLTPPNMQLEVDLPLFLIEAVLVLYWCERWCGIIPVFSLSFICISYVIVEVYSRLFLSWFYAI